MAISSSYTSRQSVQDKLSNPNQFDYEIWVLQTYDYLKDILQSLFLNQNHFAVSSDAMRVSQQSEVNQLQWEEVTEWMLKLLKVSTFHIYSFTCLYMSIKTNMPLKCPDIIQFFQICNIDPEVISKEDIINCEMNILRLLKLRLNPPCPGEIMRMILGDIRLAYPIYEKIEMNAQSNINLCLIDYSISHFSPFSIAITAIINALEQLETKDLRSIIMKHVIQVVPNVSVEEILECKRAVMHLIYGNSVGSQSCLLSPAEDIALLIQDISFSTSNGDVSRSPETLRLMTTPSQKNPSEPLPLDTIVEAEIEDSNYVIKDINPHVGKKVQPYEKHINAISAQLNIHSGDKELVYSGITSIIQEDIVPSNEEFTGRRKEIQMRQTSNQDTQRKGHGPRMISQIPEVNNFISVISSPMQTQQSPQSTFVFGSNPKDGSNKQMLTPNSKQQFEEEKKKLNEIIKAIEESNDQMNDSPQKGSEEQSNHTTPFSDMSEHIQSIQSPNDGEGPYLGQIQSREKPTRNMRKYQLQRFSKNFDRSLQLQEKHKKSSRMLMFHRGTREDTEDSEEELPFSKSFQLEKGDEKCIPKRQNASRIHKPRVSSGLVPQSTNLGQTSSRSRVTGGNKK